MTAVSSVYAQRLLMTLFLVFWDLYVSGDSNIYTI